MYKTFFIALGLFLGSVAVAGAASIFITAQGGTGAGSFTSSQLLYGAGTNPLQTVATTTATCTGGTTCNVFTVIGSSPITINSSAASGSPFPFTPTTNYGVNTSATSTPIWARVGLFASSTSNFDQINVGSTTGSTMATSTFFGNLLIKGTASSTALIVSNVPNCSGTNAINTTVAGLMFCGLVTGDGIGAWFIPSTNFGALTNATGTPIWFQQGIQASTTSQFVNGVFSGTLGVASTSPFSSLSVGTGVASSSITVAEYKYGKTGNVATSTTANIDCNASTQIAWPIGVSASTLTLINLTPGKTCRVVVQNPNAVAGAITWAVPAGYILKWAGGTVPTQTTGANLMDVWSFLATQGSSTIQVIGAITANN